MKIWKEILQTPPHTKINANGSLLEGNSRKRDTPARGGEDPNQDTMKGNPGNQLPAKQVRESNLKEVPEDYYGGMCPRCTVVVPNHNAEGCQAKAISQNWGLLLL